MHSLKKNGIVGQRYNLTNAEFIKNDEINRLIMKGSVDILQVTVLDGETVKTKAYPINDEIAAVLNV